MSRCGLTSSSILLGSEIIIAAGYWAYMIFQVRCQLTSYTLQSSPWVCSITVPFYRPGKKWLERLTWSWASYFNPDLYHPKSWVFCCSFLRVQSLPIIQNPALIISSSIKAFLLSPTRSYGGEFKLQVICIILMALIYLYIVICINVFYFLAHKFVEGRGFS